MSPVQHPVSGDVLSFELAQEMDAVRRELAGAAGRVARTLVKEGALRITLVGVSAGGGLREHKADGPISIEVLEGDVEVEAGGRRWPLASGALLVLEAGAPHAVRSARGGLFLLTLVGPASQSARRKPPDAAATRHSRPT
jgi:quercetin dioxygenase-like cupin family protein